MILTWATETPSDCCHLLWPSFRARPHRSEYQLALAVVARRLQNVSCEAFSMAERAERSVRFLVALLPVLAAASSEPEGVGSLSV